MKNILTPQSRTLEDEETEDSSTMRGLERRMGELELLPAAVVHSILERLDVASLCTVGASCRLLRKLVMKEVVPRLECVHLPRDTFLNVEEVACILASNTKLLSLNLDCSCLVTDAGLSHVIKPTLQELTLYKCDALSADLLVSIGQRCSALRALHLELGWRSLHHGHSRGLETIIEGCKTLESLSLRFEGSCFDSESFNSIPRLARGNLKTLELGFLAERDAKVVLEVRLDVMPTTDNSWGGYPVLEKLCLGLDRITDSLLATIASNLPSLQDLELRDKPMEEPLLGFDLTNVGVITIGRIVTLRRLSLVRSDEWYPASFKRVSDLGILVMVNSCVNLESVRLSGFSRITDAACKSFLHTCPNLHTFEVNNMTQVTDLTFHDLSATSLKLETVDLSSCILLTDSPIVRLAECRGLQYLNLNGCRSVGDEGVKAISTLPSLKILNLKGTDISDFGLWCLGRGVTPLAELSLRGCQRVTGSGVYALLVAGISKSLEILDLSGIPSLTDETTKHVVESGVQLTELWLRDCPLLTRHSVALLAESSCGETLRVLDLWNSGRIKQIDKWLNKPYFPRLRWIGLLAQVPNLKETRRTLVIRRDGWMARRNDWLTTEYVDSSENQNWTT